MIRGQGGKDRLLVLAAVVELVQPLASAVAAVAPLAVVHTQLLCGAALHLSHVRLARIWPAVSPPAQDSWVRRRRLRPSGTGMVSGRFERRAYAHVLAPVHVGSRSARRFA